MWSVIRIKKETLDLLNKVKAHFLANDIKISKDELIVKGLNEVMEKWKKNK